MDWFIDWLMYVQVFKIYGTGPKQIHDNMMEFYYKYNSGTISFDVQSQAFFMILSSYYRFKS